MTAVEALGDALARIRQQSGLTVEYVAGQAGVSPRTLNKIEAGDLSVSIGRYLHVSDCLGARWLFDLAGAGPDSHHREPLYLTGRTALNIPDAGRPTADWHGSLLFSVNSWEVAGFNIEPTFHLLGWLELREVTEALKGMDMVLPRVWAASYERAVFDLLHHFLHVKARRVPNIQAFDIDHAVNFQKIDDWINGLSGCLHPATRGAMKSWLEMSDEFKTGS